MRQRINPYKAGRGDRNAMSRAGTGRPRVRLGRKLTLEEIEELIERGEGYDLQTRNPQPCGGPGHGSGWERSLAY